MYCSAMRDITSSGPPSSLSSVTNALRAIRIVEHRGSVSVTELSEELAVGKSTAHRLLSTLLAEGFVVRDPIRRNYRTGGIFMAAGLAALGPLDVRRRVHGPMLRLADRVKEFCYCTVLDGANSRIIHDVHRTEAKRTAKAQARASHLVLAHASAGGKVLLAYRTPAEVREVFGGVLTELTPNTVTDWEAFDVELATTRARGWGVSIDEAADGVSVLAVAIPGVMAQPYAALNVAVTTDSFTPSRRSELLVALRESAEQVAQTTAS